jgi:hypothetical protein
VVVEGNGGNDWKGGCGHPLFQGKVAPWGAGVVGMLGSRELRVLKGYCSGVPGHFPLPLLRSNYGVRYL